MNNELIYIRVLEQDLCDQVRIGSGYPIFADRLDEEVERIKKAYDERLSWCGGWTEENNNKYHQRIALVDAETFKSVREIWNKKK